jgi:hypothetical protein
VLRPVRLELGVIAGVPDLVPVVVKDAVTVGVPVLLEVNE